MSTNLRKAQKHMQRAEELLLNQNQFGFGVNREQRPRNKEEEYSFFPKMRQYVEIGSYTELQEILDKQTFHHGQALDKINKMNFKRMKLHDAKEQMMKEIYPSRDEKYSRHGYFKEDVPNLLYMIQDDKVPLEEFELALINYKGRLLVYTAIDIALRFKLNGYEEQTDKEIEIGKMISAGGVSEYVAKKYTREIEAKKESQEPRHKKTKRS